MGIEKENKELEGSPLDLYVELIIPDEFIDSTNVGIHIGGSSPKGQYSFSLPENTSDPDPDEIKRRIIERKPVYVSLPDVEEGSVLFIAFSGIRYNLRSHTQIGIVAKSYEFRDGAWRENPVLAFNSNDGPFKNASPQVNIYR